MSYLGLVWAIAGKDLVRELRTKERLSAMGAFVVLVGILFNFGIAQEGVRPQDVASGLIWMTMIFGAMLGLGRTFEMEEQDGALDGLVQSPIPLDALYLGKVVANTVLLGIVVALILVIFGAFFRLSFRGDPLAFAAVMSLGVVGLVAVTTLFSAMSSKTSMGESLLPVLVFPLVVPLVTFGTSATTRLFLGRPVAEVSGNLRILAAFAIGGVVVGAWLFRFVIEE